MSRLSVGLGDTSVSLAGASEVTRVDCACRGMSGRQCASVSAGPRGVPCTWARVAVTNVPSFFAAAVFNEDERA